MSRLIMGHVAGPYGIQGWIKVVPYTASSDGLSVYRTWWIGSGSTWRALEIRESAVHGATLVAHPADIDDRETAAALKGMQIAVDREALPELQDDEIYLADLIGLQAVNEADERLGEVVEVFSNGAHEVLRIRGGEVERLVPFVPAIVREVNPAVRRIVLEWGLDW